jgi:hypothetical protein
MNLSKLGFVLFGGAGASSMADIKQVINRGPVTILWDYENCPAPRRSRGLSGTVIVKRLRDAFVHLGPISEVKAFGNVSTIPPDLREELQTSAVSVVDAIAVNKRKDLVDKMIFSHMFCFALDHRPPATIVLIAGDVDYALPLAALSLRHYFIVLVLPSNAQVSEKLIGIANQVYHWEDILFPERMTACSTTASEDASSSSSDKDDHQSMSEDEEDAEDVEARISGQAAQLHLRDLFRVLLELFDAGDEKPFVSKVGIHLRNTFPKIFKRKETLPQLIKLAEEKLLVSIGGSGAQRFCRFDPLGLQRYIDHPSNK